MTVKSYTTLVGVMLFANALSRKNSVLAQMIVLKWKMLETIQNLLLNHQGEDTYLAQIKIQPTLI